MIRAIALVLVACSSPRAPAPPDRCAALRARFDDTLAHAPGTCATAADCGCIPNGLGSHPACNGVTDRATAAQLAKLGDELVAQCPTSTTCPGNECAPECVAGRCTITSAEQHDDDDTTTRTPLEPHDRVVRVPTRRGVDVPVLVRDASTPKGIVLLYPGGGGQLGLTAAGLEHGGDNFTVRTRGLFATAGFVAIVVDAPSDHRESLSAYRIGTDAAADTAQLAAWASATWHAPVWLVGTSRGTISVGNAAARNVPVHGIVLTSSVTAGAREKSTLGDVAVDAIAVPVLLVHHVKDGCNASPLAGAIELRRKLVHAKDVGWREIRGGETDRSASKCSPRSHHGYLGQDADVVAAIVEYMTRD